MTALQSLRHCSLLLGFSHNIPVPLQRMSLTKKLHSNLSFVFLIQI